MEIHDGQVPFQFGEKSESPAPGWIAKAADRAKQRREQETIAAGLPEWPEKARGIPERRPAVISVRGDSQRPTQVP
jgi:hypothetical protein